ncbi:MULTISPECIES: hypothetical protein [unclassified Acidovorax]|uniref:hypothetical protein n=1 Tax=unclassified Acidovorax TaxID=2684926 RepID=UPI002882FE50|nr:MULTISPECIES: hypothetical protein [unclassified Acidovorax]
MASNVYFFEDKVKNRDLKDGRKKGSEVEGANIQKCIAKQLSLQFEKPHDLIFVFPHEFNQIQGFVGFLESQSIEIILDLRAAPRLDFAATDRRGAFREFNRLNVTYVDILGRTDFLPGKSFEAQMKIIESVKSELGRHLDVAAPVLMLFDDIGLYNMCGQALVGLHEIIKLDPACMIDENTDSDQLQM